MIIKQFVFVLASFVLFVSGSDKLVQEESQAFQSATLAQTTEYEEIKAFSMLLNLIDIICQETLKQEDKETFALNWMEGLVEFVQEIYKKNSYQEFQLDSAVNNFDSETLRPELDFDKETFMSTGEILFSDDSSSEVSDEDREFRAEKIHPLLMNSLIKSKMFKGGDENDSDGNEDYIEDFEPVAEQESFDVATLPLTSNDSDEEKHDYDYDYDSDFKQDNLQCHFPMEKKRKGGRRRIGGIETSMMNMATSGTVSQVTGGMIEEVARSSEITRASVGLDIATGAPPTSCFDQAAMMEQLQQQIMSQLMEQLVQQNPQLAQFSSLLQDERGKLTAALGTDTNGLPQLSREGVINFLRTSALPKLLNSAIKGKTGVDILKSLAMALRVINEGLGILEVVLKMILKTTRTVRYYALCTSSIVADMAREDNMTPVVDLSVSMDTLPDVAAKKSMMGGINKMFRKSLKKSGADDGENNSSSSSLSPFTLGMQAALSKSRDYASQFQQLPPALLLTLIHTLFTESDKRNGIIRSALAGKQHKTLIEMQDRVNKAVETVYRAIIKNTPEAADHLHNVPARVFTDILLSLISPVKLKPVQLDRHLVEVTKWIKPLMSIMDQDAQLNVLNFLLTDPEAEQVFTKSNGKCAPVKTFNWSFHNNHGKK